MIVQRPQWQVLILLLVALSYLSVRADDKPPATLQVRGESGKLVAVSAETWAKLPRLKAEAKGKAGDTLHYEGVALAEVLKSAGVSFDGHPRSRISSYVLIEAPDGYRVILSLAEVDPAVSDRLVLLADRVDGKPLSAEAGPYRLVIPGDKIPVRSVRQVIRIGVHRHPDKPTEKK
jgi:DMSO/TMAO reductase YedYZ molybdopterin-dependent catalytic subunit